LSSIINFLKNTQTFITTTHKGFLAFGSEVVISTEKLSKNPDGSQAQARRDGLDVDKVVYEVKSGTVG
jgi:hypothetical protein